VSLQSNIVTNRFALSSTGVKSKSKEKLPRPASLPFTELFVAFAAFEAFEAFASLLSCPYLIFSLLTTNKPIEPKIKQNYQVCKHCKHCKRFKMDMNKNRTMEFFNFKIGDIHPIKYPLMV